MLVKSNLNNNQSCLAILEKQRCNPSEILQQLQNKGIKIYIPSMYFADCLNIIKQLDVSASIFFEAFKFSFLTMLSIPTKELTETICLTAVKQNGLALQFVPEEKKTEEICLVAVQNDDTALQFVPQEKRTDEILLASVY